MCACAQHDVRAHELTATLEVADPDCRALDDGVVATERALDLEGAEAVPPARDHVLGASDQPDESILVRRGDVSRHVPVAAKRGLRHLWGIPVVGEERGRASPERELALGAGLDDVALIVDHGDLVADDREADRPRPEAGVDPVRDDDCGLGSPIAFMDRHAPGLLVRLDHVAVEDIRG